MIGDIKPAAHDTKYGLFLDGWMGIRNSLLKQLNMNLLVREILFYGFICILLPHFIICYSLIVIIFVYCVEFCF